MMTRVSTNSQNLICRLSAIIVADWTAKIQRETNALPPFNFSILISCPSALKMSLAEQSGRQDCIIVLSDLEKSPSQILALSQQLSTFGQNSTPFVPAFVAEITVANCVAIQALQFMYASLAQVEPGASKQASIHHMSCVDCVKYFGAFNVSARANGMMSMPRGQNILDGGAPFYSFYQTRKGLLAVGNLEPKFYHEMVEQMGLSADQKQFCLQNQLNLEAWPQIRSIFAQAFLGDTAEGWEKTMLKRDTCVTAVKQVIEFQDSFLHPELIMPKL